MNIFLIFTSNRANILFLCFCSATFFMQAAIYDTLAQLPTALSRLVMKTCFKKLSAKYTTKQSMQSAQIAFKSDSPPLSFPTRP